MTMLLTALEELVEIYTVLPVGMVVCLHIMALLIILDEAFEY